VPEDQIIWMSSTSNIDDGACTRSTPCKNFVYALTQANGARLHLVLEPGLYFARIGVQVPNFFIHGNGAIVTQLLGISGYTLQLLEPMNIRDITLSEGASLLAGAEGIVLDSITFVGNPKRLTVSPAGFSTKASLLARNLRITNSADTTAIDVRATGELTIDGGEISGGTVGIQGEPGAKVHLTNVMIWGTSQRALELALATGDVEFSTIADAGAATQSAPCAVSCNPNLRVTSSIIWQPSCAIGAADAAGACTFQSSIVSNGPAPGLTNVDPRFVNRAGRDYHLQPSSPAKDAVGTGPAADFERDPRPRGARFDIGADEAPP
jgi:hypothetical protein